MVPDSTDVARLREAQATEWRTREALLRAHRWAARFEHDRAVMILRRMGIVLLLVAALTGAVGLTITYWPWPLVLIVIMFPITGYALTALVDSNEQGTRLDGQYRARMLAEADDAYEGALIELMHAERGMPLALVCPRAGIEEWEREVAA